MADQITVRGSDSKFKPHPDGQYVGQCVDTINLGERVEFFSGAPTKVSPKCAIVFRTGERNEATGEYVDIAREFTASMNEKANLRKFLEQWRGKPYTSEQIEAGVPLDRLTGAYGLLTIAHQVSASKRVYGVITACVGVPKQMMSVVTAYPDYKRDEYWEQRKKEYAEGVRKFRSEAAVAPESYEEFPDALRDDETDDLPF